MRRTDWVCQGEGMMDEGRTGDDGGGCEQEGMCLLPEAKWLESPSLGVYAELAVGAYG